MKKLRNIRTSVFILLIVCIACASLPSVSQNTLNWSIIAALGIWAVYVVFVWKLPTIKAFIGKAKHKQTAKKSQQLPEQTSDKLQIELNQMRCKLYQQITVRITDAICRVYPEADWTWNVTPESSFILLGGTERIRLNGVPDFTSADVYLSPEGELKVFMVQANELTHVEQTKLCIEAADRWLIAGQNLGPIIEQLRHQGQTSLYISQFGDVYTNTDDTPYSRIAPLPPQEGIATLADRISRQYNVRASVHDGQIMLSW